MSNVIDIHGVHKHGIGDPDPRIVEWAEQLLDQCKSGYVVNVVAVLETHDEAAFCCFGVESRIPMTVIGTLERIKHMILHKQTSDRDDLGLRRP